MSAKPRSFPRLIFLCLVPAVLLAAGLYWGPRDLGTEVKLPDQSGGIDQDARARTAQSYGPPPMYFIENRGQVNKQVKYYARGNGYSMFFTQDGMVLTLARQAKAEGHETPGPLGLDQGRERRQPRSGEAIFKAVSHKFQDLIAPSLALSPPRPLAMELDKSGMRQPFPGRKGRLAWQRNHEKPAPVEASVVRMAPVGMQKKVKVKALRPQEGKVNYCIGNDPQKWRTNIPTYAGVLYQEAYKGIDLKFYGNGRELEYDIVVKPGADPNLVKFHYTGIQSLAVTPTGDLAIKLPDGGTLLQKKPVVYQEIAGVRVAREGKFKLQRNVAGHNYGFEVAAYDRNRPLVIDPVLLFSTYLGSGNDDFCYGIALDPQGNILLTGATGAAFFPTKNALYPVGQGASDAFVTKMKADGSALIFSTYLGGKDDESGRGIGVDGQGNIYVTGWTSSTNFPVKNALYPTKNGFPLDIFMTKITSDGSELLYSTFLGGTDMDYPYGIAVDLAGHACVTGHTQSTDFPVKNALYPSPPAESNAFVTKFKPDGSDLVFSTYLGGNSYDYGYAIAVDLAGNPYIAGETRSTDFPTRNAFMPDKLGTSSMAFVTKFRADGSELLYSTYLGGTGGNTGYAIAVDREGCAYVTGVTSSADFPTWNPLFPIYGGANDVFVTKLTANGSGLAFSTFLGKGGNETGYGIAVDPAGNIYVTGKTDSQVFPLKNPLFSIRQGAWDAFVTKIGANGNGWYYSTYLGGWNWTEGHAIAADAAGNAYITGSTGSTNFPVKNALYPTSKGNAEVFIVKIGSGQDPIGVLQLLLID